MALCVTEAVAELNGAKLLAVCHIEALAVALALGTRVVVSIGSLRTALASQGSVSAPVVVCVVNECGGGDALALGGWMCREML